MKKKNFVCIFAHPDDEAFTAAGLIYKLAQKYNVYILCATRGQQGQDSAKDMGSKLSDIRANELKESARILGVKKVFFLGFRDGTLCNNVYHKLATKIEKHLVRLEPEEIMTFSSSGNSGHIDHIVMHYVTMFVARKLSYVKKILFPVFPKEVTEQFGSYFIYYPEGYKRSEVDKIVKISDIWDIKIAAMKCHKSQKHDYERLLGMFEKLPKEEYFIIKHI